MRPRRRSCPPALPALPALLLLLAPPALAGFPPRIHHEGLLLDGDGLPMDEDEVSIRFTLYDAPADGAVLWAEDHDVSPVGGYYRVTFGVSRSLEAAFDADAAWLGISIDGAAELDPRHPLAAVPYAFVAGNAVGDLTPRSVTVGGRLVVDGEGNWVGPVGSILESLRDADGPDSGLDADRLDGLDSTQFPHTPQQVLALLKQADGGGSGLNADRLDDLDSAQFMRSDGDTRTTGALTVDGTLTSHDVRVAEGHNVGVGVADPEAELDVAGRIRAAAMLLDPLDVEPAEPVPGTLYFDAEDGVFRGFTGGRWVTFGEGEEGGEEGEGEPEGPGDAEALRALILADAASAYWPLNEEWGTVAHDRSGFDRHGTYRGNVELAVPGQASLAVDFRAAGYVTTGVRLADLFDGLNGTVTAIVKLPAGLTDFGVAKPSLIPHQIWSTWAWYQGLSVGTYGGVSGLHFWNYHTGSELDHVAVAARPGTWVHVAWVWRGDRLYGYVNGVEHSVAAHAVIPQHSQEEFNIARRFQDRTYAPTYPSLIQHVAVFPRGLSAERVRAHAAAAGTRIGTPEAPGESCKAIFETGTADEDGTYWIDPNGDSPDDAIEVFCDMTHEGGGWTRVADVDPARGCPGAWVHLGNPQLCYRATGSRACRSATFDTLGVSFREVRGYVRAYQYYSMDGFHMYSPFPLDDTYVDGVSITVGAAPRTHVWTYAVGISRDGDYPNYNCPCAGHPGGGPPGFVGQHYYCESGNSGGWEGRWYTDDPLYDGQGCPGGNSCCSPPDLPWFRRNLGAEFNTHVEARLCSDQESANEDVGVYRMELYVR